MNIRDLSVFIDLANSLHFGRTAEKHYMSPSTLSRVVQRLELQAGVSLLQRNNRSVSLTKAGERYRQYARQSLSAWQAFQDDMGIGSDKLQGLVSLYCSVTASHSLLSGILADLRERQPSIEIKLHTGDQALSINRVKEGGDDFAIGVKPDVLDRQIAFRSLTTSRLLFIAPRRPCAVSETLSRWQDSAFDWAALPWIVADRGESRQRLDRWFREQKIKPSIYAQVSGHEAIVSMVALGFGVGLVPELVLTSSPVFDSIQIIRSSFTDSFSAYAEFEIGLCALQQRLSEPLMQAVWNDVQLDA